MKRQVLQNGVRDECGGEMETIEHVLWNCHKARETWALLKVVVPRGGEVCGSFHYFLWHLVMTDRVEETKIALIVTIAWALWCNRNEVRTGGKRKSGREITTWAATYLAE
nr:hypothetical protein CFP56_15447 [Quercus suber]